MSINYDKPTSVQDFIDAFNNNDLPEEIREALNNLLQENATDGEVDVGSGEVDEEGNVDLPPPPQGRDIYDILIINKGSNPQRTATENQPIKVNLPASAAQSPVVIIQGDVGLDITLNTVPRVIITGRGNDKITVNGDKNTTIETGGGSDTLITSGGNDLINLRAENAGSSSISTGAGNDTILAGTGNDTIDGGEGIDFVRFAGNTKNAYMITKTDSGFDVKAYFDETDIIYTASLKSIERFEFKDGSKLAFDLTPEGNAGKALQFINVLAANFVKDKDAAVLGEILGYFDTGLTLLAGAQLAVDVGLVAQLAGGASNEHLVKLVYKNVMGEEASDQWVDILLSYMDGRVESYTQAQFIATVAALDVNNDAIGLAGLQEAGVDYL